MPLIVVPTPVGNLKDMTLRGLSVLREADVIACEDTRHTLQLLNHYEIKKPLISCHEHNEAERSKELSELVAQGKNVALVSDAGMPGLSDPGGKVVKYMLERGLPVDVLPGANALLPALLLSGIDMERFTFVGFLKGKTSEKKAQLLELSKIHQETIRGTLNSFKNTVSEEKIRGEFVCVVEGKKEQESSDAEWRAQVQKLVDAGESVKNIVKLIAEKYGVPKNSVKQLAMKR